MSLRWYFVNIHKNKFYKLFYESWLMTHKNQFYKILYESRLIFHKHTKQAVIFSVLWKIINMNLYRIVGFWISWAWTHDMSLDSYLWRFIEIFLWAFIELTPYWRKLSNNSFTDRHHNSDLPWFCNNPYQSYAQSWNLWLIKYFLEVEFIL
jgi:hypothetical protein